MSDNETLADIIAEMRNRAARREISPEVYGLADRLEAAAKWEASEAELKWSRVGYEERMAEEKKCDAGNAAAMRAALAKCLAVLSDGTITCRCDEAEDAKAMARAALDALERNCDVGTPETQVIRMAAYCRSHQDTEVTLCKRCHIKCDNWFLCALRWAQMPYEAEGGEE